jgi:hypothetical protein
MLIGGLGILVMGIRPNIFLITAACFTFFLSMPFVQGSFEILVRTKIGLEIQGRVFAFIRVIAMISTTVAYVLAGPLADYIFEPLMAADGALAGSVGLVIGTGPGRGIGLLLLICGFLIALVTALGYSNQRVRHVETELPDVVTAVELAESELIPLFS